MNDTYKWLYHNYAAPQLKDIKEAEDAQINLLMQAHLLPPAARIGCIDLLHSIRFQWGSEVFLLGLQMGMDLVESPRTSESV